MARELAALQTPLKTVDDTYGTDNLPLTVACAYIAELLAKSQIARWLTNHQEDYLGQFEKSRNRFARPYRRRVQRPIAGWEQVQAALHSSHVEHSDGRDDGSNPFTPQTAVFILSHTSAIPRAS